MIREGIYGLLAEFDTPGALAHAAERAHTVGYRKMDAYTPYPIEEISEAIGFRRNYVALVTLIGGILGVFLHYVRYGPKEVDKQEERKP